MILSQSFIDELKMLRTHELKNSITYKSLAHQLRSEGLFNLADYLTEWSGHERDHSDMVEKYLESMDIQVPFESIPETKLIDDITKFYEVILDAETTTTKLWEKALEKAYEEEFSGTASEMAKWFVNEQIEEMGKTNDLISQVKPFTGNLALLHLFDQNFSG